MHYHSIRKRDSVYQKKFIAYDCVCVCVCVCVWEGGITGAAAIVICSGALKYCKQSFPLVGPNIISDFRFSEQVFVFQNTRLTAVGRLQ